MVLELNWKLSQRLITKHCFRTVRLFLHIIELLMASKEQTLQQSTFLWQGKSQGTENTVQRTDRTTAIEQLLAWLNVQLFSQILGSQVIRENVIWEYKINFFFLSQI